MSKLTTTNQHSAIVCKEKRPVLFLTDSLGSEGGGYVGVKSCKTWQGPLWESAVVRFLAEGKASDHGCNDTLTNSRFEWHISLCEDISHVGVNQAHKLYLPYMGTQCPASSGTIVDSLPALRSEAMIMSGFACYWFEPTRSGAHRCGGLEREPPSILPGTVIHTFGYTLTGQSIRPESVACRYGVKMAIVLWSRQGLKRLNRCLIWQDPAQAGFQPICASPRHQQTGGVY